MLDAHSIAQRIDIFKASETAHIELSPDHQVQDATQLNLNGVLWTLSNKNYAANHKAREGALLISASGHTLALGYEFNGRHYTHNQTPTTGTLTLFQAEAGQYTARAVLRTRKISTTNPRLVALQGYMNDLLKDWGTMRHGGLHFPKAFYYALKENEHLNAPGRAGLQPGVR